MRCALMAIRRRPVRGLGSSIDSGTLRSHPHRVLAFMGVAFTAALALSASTGGCTADVVPTSSAASSSSSGGGGSGAGDLGGAGGDGGAPAQGGGGSTSSSGGAGGGSGGQGGAPCHQGDTAACQTGLSGVCAPGTKTCMSGGVFGPCVGAVLPAIEDCSTATDEDCDGNPSCTGDGLRSK